jgi:chlorobactene glucosyltransferase
VDAIGQIDLLVSCGWVATVGWLLFHAVNQSRLFGRIAAASWLPGKKADQVVVVVPARNESSNIRRCVESLLGQRYPRACLRVVVVDDDSTDDTVAVVQSIAERQSALALQRSPSLPSGWTGKSHACWVGAGTISSDAEWICFIDADVWGEPDLIASAVEYAARNRIDLLSLAPRHELGSFAERLMLPCGHYLLAFCQDLRKQQKLDTAVQASGQFMLIRRRMYEAVGGHAAVARAICEDVALARLVKRMSGNVVFLSGDGLLSTRMYTGWQTLWPGIAKNLVETLGGPPSTALIAGLAVILSWAAFIVPAHAAVTCANGSSGACAALLPALIGSAGALALHVAGAIHFGIPFWYGLIFPLGYTAGAAMALDSIRRRLMGHVSWKGRIYS